MAAGRGEFITSLLEGLERTPMRPCPQEAPARRQPGPGERQAGPDNASVGQMYRKWRKGRPQGAMCSGSGRGNSFSSPRISEFKIQFPKSTPSQENLIERLPSEILLNIVSYLDASSLFSISHVSKLFHQLSNDNVVWKKIYMSQFGRQTWKPKSWAGDERVKVTPVEEEVRSPGHWKKMYFRALAGQDMSKWRGKMKDISPYTGLPTQTEWVLRNLNVSWELKVCAYSGQEVTTEQSRAHFAESSVIVHWGGRRFPNYHQIRDIQLYGVRKETLTSLRARRPGWRSLIVKLDREAQHSWIFGKDDLINLRHLQPGFIVGTWRGEDSVAFIMASLHYHKLVERSLLGSPVCPYSEPVYLPPVDKSDPEFGLHGYSLHFVLHNSISEIMSGHYPCRTVQIRNGLVELRVINRSNVSQHRALSGGIKLPWRSEELEGSVENCCVMTLTLLDESQKPFWCVSSPIFITREKRRVFCDYGGEHFLMIFQHAEGKVKMKLAWLKEQKQFFIIGLSVYVCVLKLNKHFCTAY